MTLPGSCNQEAYCKVSVRVGLGNEPRDLQTPLLSVNPPRVARLDPVCALMDHVTPPLRHQLTRQSFPSSLASPLLPRRCRPSPSSSFSSLPSWRRHSSFRSTRLKILADVAPPLVCATSALPLNICQAIAPRTSSSTLRSSVLPRTHHHWKEDYRI